MTKIDDLPKALAHGTLTACRQCGRLAIFARPNSKSTSTQDIWTCACLTENAVPTRDPAASIRQGMSGAFPEPHDRTKEG